MEKMDKPCDEHKCPSLQIDHSKTYQTVVGFGGAFTEAAAINWRLLSQHDQEEVIRRYFASPEEGGLGYTLGRVPINSCDFSPASYNFDNVTGDMDLKNFDMSVKHDVEVGMVPMIKAAQDMISKRGAKLMLYASPWSPPAWMKLTLSTLSRTEGAFCVIAAPSRWQKGHDHFGVSKRAGSSDAAPMGKVRSLFQTHSRLSDFLACN
eukprot:6196896-Pleurochrysis_carterae.AAC.3